MRILRKKSPGFTLAEVLIVVAIIAVLVAVGFPMFTASLTKAKLAVDNTHYRVMQTYSSVMQTEGEITIGDTVVRPSDSDYQVYCFLDDGTLSGDIVAESLPPVPPENAYRAMADSDVFPQHKEGDYLVLILDKAVLKPNVWWVPENGWWVP